MGFLTDIKNKLEELRVVYNSTDTPPPIKIDQSVFDDLSAINGNSQQPDYILLTKPPVSTGDKSDRSLEYSICNMDMFMFAPELSSNEAPWTEEFDNAHAMMRGILKLLFLEHPAYVLWSDITYTPGHHQHNGNFIACRAQFKMRVYNGC